MPETAPEASFADSADARLLRRAVESRVKLQEATIDVLQTLGGFTGRDLAFSVSDAAAVGGYAAGQPPWYQDNVKAGEWIPVYRTEAELKAIRDRTRVMCAYNEFAICALENRINYVVGEGLKYTATPKDPLNRAMKASAKAVQEVIDEWHAENNLPEIEAEALWRLDVEGEFFLRTFADKKGCHQLRFVEPEHVRAPNGASNDPAVSFGIANDADDIAGAPKGYWIVEDPLIDTAPVEVGAGDVVHAKLNTWSAAKRGLPTFYPVEANLKRCEDLLASMTSTAKARAKIALIRKVTGLTSATADSLLSRLTAARVTDPTTGDSLNIEQLRYGTVLTASGNTDYEMPGANLGASDIVDVLQAELRAIASRMVMPEWMFTALADAKYNNAFIVEAPTLKSFKRLQRRMCDVFGRWDRGPRVSLLWRQLRAAVAAGRLEQSDIDSVVVGCTGPSLEARDPQGEVTRHKELVASGFESKETAQRSLELDPEKEAPLIARETVGKARPTADASAVAQTQEAFYAGKLPRDAAAANLMILLGFTREQAEQLLPASDCVKRTDDGQPANPMGAPGDGGGAPGGGPGDGGMGGAAGQGTGGGAAGDDTSGVSGANGAPADPADALLTQALTGGAGDGSQPAPVPEQMTGFTGAVVVVPAQPPHIFAARLREAILKLREAGFTGEVTAKNGVVYHYVDGKRVSAADHAEHVAKGGQPSPVIKAPDADQFANIIHLVGSHYTSKDADWKVAGKAIDKILKKYGGGQAEWDALAAQFGYDTGGKKSVGGLLNAIKAHLDANGADPDKVAAAKGDAPAEEPKPGAEAQPKPAPEAPASALLIAADVPAMFALLNAPAGTPAANVIHAAIDSLDADGWDAVASSYGVSGGKTQTTKNKLYGKIAAKATGDHTHDGDAWGDADFAALFNTAAPAQPSSEDATQPATQDNATPAQPALTPQHQAAIDKAKELGAYVASPQGDLDPETLAAELKQLEMQLPAHLHGQLYAAVGATDATNADDAAADAIGNAQAANAATPQPSSEAAPAPATPQPSSEPQPAKPLFYVLDTNASGGLEMHSAHGDKKAATAAAKNKLGAYIMGPDGKVYGSDGKVKKVAAHTKIGNLAYAMKTGNYVTGAEHIGIDAPGVTPEWMTTKQDKEAQFANSGDTFSDFDQQQHLDAIAVALKQGKPVPPAVIQSYPELAQMYGAQPAATPQPSSAPASNEPANAADNDPPHGGYAGKKAEEIDSTWKPAGSPAYGAIVTRTDPATGKKQILLRKPTGGFGGYAWTFPKGKQDKHPDPATAAIAEVGEETGHKAKITGHLPGTFHSGSGDSTNFFIAESTGHDPALMDAETEATQWVDVDTAHELINQTTNPGGKKRDLDVLAAVKQHLGAGATPDATDTGPNQLGSPNGHKPTTPQLPTTTVNVAGATKPSDIVPGWAAMDGIPPDKQKFVALTVKIDPATGQILASPVATEATGAATVAGKLGGAKAFATLAQPLGSGGVSQYGGILAHADAGAPGTFLPLAQAKAQMLAYAGSASAKARVEALFAELAKHVGDGTAGPDAKVNEAAQTLEDRIHGLGEMNATPAEVTASVKQALSGLHPDAVKLVAAKMGTTPDQLVKHVSDKVNAVKGLPSLANIKNVKPIGQGSTGAKVGIAANGAKVVIKDGGTTTHGQEQVGNEVAADAIYKILGANVPNSKVQKANGKDHKIAQWVEGQPLGEYLASATPAQQAAVKKEIQKQFVVTALLGNWDVVGLAHDNIKVTPDGKPYLIDNGGSFDISANAQKKGGTQKPFHADSVPELDTLLDPAKAPQAAGVFKGITKQDMLAQIANVLAKKDAILAATPAAHKAAVAGRISHLESWAASDGDPAAAVVLSKPHGAKLSASEAAKVPEPGLIYTGTPPSAKGYLKSSAQVNTSSYSKNLPAPIHDAAAKWKKSVAKNKPLKSAMADYTSSGYASVNAKLRRGEPLDATHQAMVDGVNAAWDTAPDWNPPIVTYRGIHLDTAEHEALKKMILDAAANGHKLQMDGMQSSTLNLDTAHSFGSAKYGTNSTHNATIFEIVTHKGPYVGIDNDGKNMSCVPHESEVLQPSGTVYKILGVKKVKALNSNGKIVEHDVFQLEQIPGEHKKPQKAVKSMGAQGTNEFANKIVEQTQPGKPDERRPTHEELSAKAKAEGKWSAMSDAADAGLEGIKVVE